MDLQGYDQGLLYAFEKLHAPWLDPIVHAITTLGNPWPMTGVVLTLACLFAWLRRYRFALVIVGIGCAAGGLHIGIKHLVDRPRPRVTWVQIPVPDQPSFPSGHAMGAMAIYLGAAMLGARMIRSRRTRIALIVAGAVVGLLVGLSRPYLGVHYPMDVLTGWIGGLICALVGVACAEPMRKEVNPPVALSQREKEESDQGIRLPQ